MRAPVPSSSLTERPGASMLVRSARVFAIYALEDKVLLPRRYDRGPSKHSVISVYHAIQALRTSPVSARPAGTIQ